MPLATAIALGITAAATAASAATSAAGTAHDASTSERSLNLQERRVALEEQYQNRFSGTGLTLGQAELLMHNGGGKARYYNGSNFSQPVSRQIHGMNSDTLNILGYSTAFNRREKVKAHMISKGVQISPSVKDTGSTAMPHTKRVRVQATTATYNKRVGGEPVMRSLYTQTSAREYAMIPFDYGGTMHPSGKLNALAKAFTPR